ncbi:hypothetical protein M378DRAFT_88550, partial [Amanita muscaria Koide BX008]
MGNEKGWFVDENKKVIQLPRLQFILDVKTRWDSVYNMIMRFLENRQPLEHFLSSPVNKDFKSLLMTAEEWSRLEDIACILECPHVVLQSMSAEKTPVLANSMVHFEMFMTNWEKLG